MDPKLRRILKTRYGDPQPDWVPRELAACYRLLSEELVRNVELKLTQAEIDRNLDKCKVKVFKAAYKQSLLQFGDSSSEYMTKEYVSWYAQRLLCVYYTRKYPGLRLSWRVFDHVPQPIANHVPSHKKKDMKGGKLLLESTEYMFWVEKIKRKRAREAKLIPLPKREKGPSAASIISTSSGFANSFQSMSSLAGIKKAANVSPSGTLSHNSNSGTCSTMTRKKSKAFQITSITGGARATGLHTPPATPEKENHLCRGLEKSPVPFKRAAATRFSPSGSKRGKPRPLGLRQLGTSSATSTRQTPLVNARFAFGKH